MMTTVPQVLLALFALARLYGGAAKYVRKEPKQTVFKLVASVAIWGAIAVVALFPEWAYHVSRRAGFGDNLNTLIFLAFIVVFAILFKLLSIIERLEANITEIVRKDALGRLGEEVSRRADGLTVGTTGTARDSAPR